jgi:hypothetical protein
MSIPPVFWNGATGYFTVLAKTLKISGLKKHDRIRAAAIPCAKLFCLSLDCMDRALTFVGVRFLSANQTTALP